MRMIRLLPHERVFTSLSVTSLVMSACANASLATNAAAIAPKEFQAAAKRSAFPTTLLTDARRYDRLTGAALIGTIAGKTVCPSKSCSEIGGDVTMFREDGIYLEFGDRWEDEGTYAIVNDIVVISLGDAIRRYAFYRSQDGTLRRAWEDRAGSIKSSIVFTR